MRRSSERITRNPAARRRHTSGAAPTTTCNQSATMMGDVEQERLSLSRDRIVIDSSNNAARQTTPARRTSGPVTRSQSRTATRRRTYPAPQSAISVRTRRATSTKRSNSSGLRRKRARTSNAVTNSSRTSSAASVVDQGSESLVTNDGSASINQSQCHTTETQVDSSSNNQCDPASLFENNAHYEVPHEIAHHSSDSDPHWSLHNPMHNIHQTGHDADSEEDEQDEGDFMAAMSDPTERNASNCDLESNYPDTGFGFTSYSTQEDSIS